MYSPATHVTESSQLRVQEAKNLPPKRCVTRYSFQIVGWHKVDLREIVQSHKLEIFHEIASCPSLISFSCSNSTAKLVHADNISLFRSTYEKAYIVSYVDRVAIVQKATTSLQSVPPCAFHCAPRMNLDKVSKAQRNFQLRDLAKNTTGI